MCLPQRLIPNHLSPRLSLTIAIREREGGWGAGRERREGYEAELVPGVAAKPRSCGGLSPRLEG